MSDVVDESPDFGYSGSRKEAIAGGIIHDASEMAKAVGYRWPVAVTHEVWEDCVAWSGEDTERQVVQTERGRLWDVLYQSSYCVRKGYSRTDKLDFDLLRVPRDGSSCRVKPVTLQIIAHMGDEEEPVLTITKPPV